MSFEEKAKTLKIARNFSDAVEGKILDKGIKERAAELTGKHRVNGQNYTISSSVALAFAKVENQTGLPAEVMINVSARESSCNPNAVHKSTGAVGLFQFMTNKMETLYETLYKYGDKNPALKEHRDLVEKYVRKTDSKGRPYYGYKPVNADAREKLNELGKDPEFNSALFAEKTMVDVRKYEAWLGNRHATAGEITVMNNLGRAGLQKFVKQAWEDKKTGNNTLAVDFFKRNEKLFGGNVSTNNRTLVKHDNGNYKTVRESYNDIMNNFGGWKSLEMKTAEASTSLPH